MKDYKNVIAIHAKNGKQKGLRKNEKRNEQSCFGRADLRFFPTKEILLTGISFFDLFNFSVSIWNVFIYSIVGREMINVKPGSFCS